MGGSRQAGPVPPVYGSGRLVDMLKGTGGGRRPYVRSIVFLMNNRHGVLHKLRLLQTGECIPLTGQALDLDQRSGPKT